MYKFDLSDRSFVTGYNDCTDYAFADLLAGTQINFKLRLLVFMTERETTLLDLPMPSIYMFEIELS